MSDIARLRPMIEPSTGKTKTWVCLTDIDKHAEKLTKTRSFQKHAESLMIKEGKKLKDFVSSVEDEVWICSRLANKLGTTPPELEKTISLIQTELEFKEEVHYSIVDLYDAEVQTRLTQKAFDKLGKERFIEYNRAIMRALSGLRSSTWLKTSDEKSGRKALRTANPRCRAQISFCDQLVAKGYDWRYGIQITKNSEGVFELAEHGDVLHYEA